MAYSIKTREKALKLLADGFTDAEVSKKVNVSIYTIQNWKKLLFTTGSLQKKKANRKPGKPYKYKPEKIKELLDMKQ